MARAVGDVATADSYGRLAESGAEKLHRELWNGEYYVQKYDPEKHPKYQFGEGCLSDQLLGQWFAEVVGLGYLLRREHVRKTLESIYRYNFSAGFQDLANPQRIYALQDEKALLLCSWPKGKRPALPFVYSDEAWTGVEYQVAAHFIYEGMLEEALALVKAVRDRYDGFRRNPWDEVECGHHYARAMASWSLVTALTGFRYSGPEKWIAFAPAVNRRRFRSFFSTGTAWGLFSQTVTATRHTAEISVSHGSLALREVRMREVSPFKAKRVTSPDGAVLADTEGHKVVRLKQETTIRPGAPLVVTLA